MKKARWKAGNMIYPLPAVMVSCGNETEANIVTVAWTGTICTNPPMTYISLRPSRYSYNLIKESGYFVINLTTEALVKETDFCGVKSGRDLEKFKEMNLTCIRDEETNCPMIEESPVSIVCETVEIKELGSHHMFIANVKAVYVDESYMDERGKFQLNKTGLMAYSHGSYLSIGEEIGTFGYSISKKKKANRLQPQNQTKKELEETQDKVKAKQKDRTRQQVKGKQASKYTKKTTLSRIDETQKEVKGPTGNKKAKGIQTKSQKNRKQKRRGLK